MAGGKIKKEKPHRGGSGAAASANPHYQGGIPFHKSKGQHILKNPLLIDTIIEKSGINSTDIILEIGPGTGNLTKKLLEAGKSVIAVELDPRMVLELQRRFQGTAFSNRLKTMLGLGEDSVWLSYEWRWCAVIMFQREFAMRLVAKPGDTLYCRLSVNTQLLSRVSHLLKVGRNNFRPPPKVDSSVVRIEPKKPQPSVSFKEWDGLVRICFNRKNKTLGSIFRQKSVLSILEKNYKTLQALQLSQNGSLEDTEIAVDVSTLADTAEDLSMEIDDERDDEDMEVEVGDTRASDFKDKILGLLKQGGFEDKRSSKLSQEDFMHLLSVFNKAGIHFS
ncbi:hypothetical protein C3L33_22261, partial [Rhododendron williamsianum]